MLLAIVVIVWALVASSRKAILKRKERINAELERLASEQNAKVSITDVMSDKAIGLDSAKGKIFYVNYVDDTLNFHVLEQADVNTCDLKEGGNRQVRTLKSGKQEVEENITTIELVLSMKGGVNVSLLFYDETTDGVLEMLPLKGKAEKWKEIIKG